MKAEIKTLQDKEFDIWKDEVAIEAKTRKAVMERVTDWGRYFQAKGLEVKIVLTEEFDFNVLCN